MDYFSTTPEDVVITDLDAHIVDGKRKPSSEWALHTIFYKNKPDMQRHCANAHKVAEFLHDHPAVKKVYYPGLKDFEGYEVAKKQMRDSGAMMSIELKADKAATAAALNKLQLCTIAVSLGDAETLVEHGRRRQGAGRRPQRRRHQHRAGRHPARLPVLYRQL